MKMDKYQAEKIINDYRGAIANDENVFRKQSSLPCSKAKIRYAFYVCIPAIIDELGCLPKDIGEKLVACYSMLDSFLINDEVDRLKKIGEMLRNKKRKELKDEEVQEYFTLTTNAFRNPNYFDEINDYIGECYDEKGIQNI